MPLTEKTFETVVLEDTEGRWELHEGRLREKPSMSVAHNRLARRLVRQLDRQLDPSRYDILHNDGHLRLPGEFSYIPDVAVVPIEAMRAFADQPNAFEAYAEPLPLVVEVWSPSTGGYDVDTKIPGYRRRGDLEIWCIHPFERTLRAWRRQPDGSYAETLVGGGAIEPVGLPGAVIDLDELFA